MFPTGDFDVLKDLDQNVIRGVWQYRTGYFGKKIDYYCIYPVFSIYNQ